MKVIDYKSIMLDKAKRDRLKSLYKLVQWWEAERMGWSKKELRQLIYDKYDGHCAYCGKEIEYTEMQVDHQIAKRNGGTDNIENLFPSCRRCNHYKRAQGIEAFREYIRTLHERIAKDYIVKVGLDYGIVTIKPFGGKFYFEILEEKLWKEY